MGKPYCEECAVMRSRLLTAENNAQYLEDQLREASHALLSEMEKRSTGESCVVFRLEHTFLTERMGEPKREYGRYVFRRFDDALKAAQKHHEFNVKSAASEGMGTQEGEEHGQGFRTYWVKGYHTYRSVSVFAVEVI